MEDLVVGLLVDAIGDLLVVLVTKASLVGSVVNLLCDVSIEKGLSVGNRDWYERVLTCLSAKPWAALLPLRESLALSISPDMFVGLRVVWWVGMDCCVDVVVGDLK